MNPVNRILAFVLVGILAVPVNGWASGWMPKTDKQKDVIFNACMKSAGTSWVKKDQCWKDRYPPIERVVWCISNESLQVAAGKMPGGITPENYDKARCDCYRDPVNTQMLTILGCS